MNYDGEKFLLKLYKELYNEQSVKHSSTKSDNKYEAIKKYIERLEKVHEKVINHKTDTGINLLKDFYYDKYVIKKEDIPESYIEYLDKVQFDQYGIHMDDWQMNAQKNLIIEDQKKSLDEWLDYFMSEDAKFYPTWAKYWAFQGMLTIGNYDTNKRIYNKRSKTTVAPFPELDREVLSKSIDLIIKETNKEEIEDKDLEKLVKNGNFFKLYTVQLKDKRNQTFGNDIKGEWIKYEQGDNYQELHKSLQGKNTGWCTAGEETCKLQVKGGDFYVYYTYDEKGKATNPRLAIRMDGKNRIGEIRGVANNQNIEPHFEDVIAKKLENFKDADSYKKRVKDTQMLTYVYTKYENHKPLTKEDIKFIYEIDNKIETMGWGMDPRLEELKNNTFKTATKEFTDKEFLIEILRKNSYLLKEIPKNMIDKELALEVAKCCKDSLEYIPRGIVDKEIAMEAVKFYTPSVKFVPKELIDKKIALEVARNSTYLMGFLPREVIDKEVALTAVRRDGSSLSDIPKEIIDKEIAIEAVKNNGMALPYVPKELVDSDIALESVKNNVKVVEFLPKKFINKEVVFEISKANAYYLKYVPKELWSRELVLLAVENTGMSLSVVPKDLIDKEIALKAVKNDRIAFLDVPKDLTDKEIVMEAIKGDEEFGLTILRLLPINLVKELCIQDENSDLKLSKKFIGQVHAYIEDYELGVRDALHGRKKITSTEGYNWGYMTTENLKNIEKHKKSLV